MDFQKPKKTIIKRKTTTTTTKTTTTKRSSKKRENKKVVLPMVDYLPTEMIAEVLARVAASSPSDLFRCKLSCKAFHEISEEKQVLEQVSMGSLISRAWRRDDNASSFFLRCLASNNSQALLYFGMVQYFSHMMLEEGLKNLEKAAEQRNMDAAYVLGLIYIFRGGKECMERGVEMIRNIIRVMGGKGIIECRKKLREMMNLMWVKNRIILQGKPEISCPMQQQHAQVKNNWESSNYYSVNGEDDVVCEVCRFSREVNFFYQLLGS